MLQSRKMILGVAVAAAAIVAPLPGAALAVTRTVSLTHAPPSLMRQKDLVTVKGTVTGVPHRTEVALQIKHFNGRWVPAARARAGHKGAFAIRWRVPGNERVGPVMLRVAALSRRGALLAATAHLQSAIGSAAVSCTPPVPPAVEIPAGDGWIVGGAYGLGGAFPGVDACLQEQYTVTATDSQGHVAASETVPGGHSYTLAPLAAGSYTLRTGACRGTATVTAGEQTTANTDCLYP